jgi:hypothetical protein
MGKPFLDDAELRDLLERALVSEPGLAVVAAVIVLSRR